MKGFLCTNPNCLEEFFPAPDDEVITDKHGNDFCSEECKEEYEEMDDWCGASSW